MTIIKSFSVGNGDMFAIRHHSDSFTIIDCCICNDNREQIFNDIKIMSHGKTKHYSKARTSGFNDIKIMSHGKTIRRFISTHPDKDHIMGLKSFDNRFKILNFYCVKNEAKKEDYDQDFEHYCKLRDSKKAFYIKKGRERHWMNLDSNERKSAGIHILWPDVNNDVNNQVFIDELKK
ncbi:MBL fold metallo-hydrolase [Helicobacter equorum]|uniref:hypothetical protein n=1 Tax=Helicobacter equorum TaxID=361872 RepID=UPI0018F82A47|nr:hypothetical protein [Helicobacter equorum]